MELDLSNYVKKSYLKEARNVDTSDFAKNEDLASFKSDVDKLDIDKLRNVFNSIYSSNCSKYLYCVRDEFLAI